MRFSWTTPDREAATMNYGETFAAIEPHAGQRVRVTYPNGAQRVGLVGRKRLGTEDVVTFDGVVCMGELAGAVRVEVMGAYHRYEEVV